MSTPTTSEPTEPTEPAGPTDAAGPDAAGPEAPAGIRGRIRALPQRLRALAGGEADAPWSGAPGAVPPSRTLGELTRRRLALLVLAVLTAGVLYPAFQGVHADARPLRSSSAPGVLAVDTAMDALSLAQQNVDDLGTTGDFHTRISVANLSLARASGDDVVGEPGRQTIQTVTGLVATYSGWIEDATAQPSGSALRTAYLGYARGMLGSRDVEPEDDSTILGRLRYLQQLQKAEVRRQTDFGPLLWTLWSLGTLLAALLCFLLVEAALFTGRRFRRRLNPALAAAVALVAGGWAALAYFTWSTHSAMDHVRGVLAPTLFGDRIPIAGTAVSRRLAGTSFHAAAAGWLVAGGVVLVALVLLGLQPRVNEYQVRTGAYRARFSALRLPRPRTALVGAVSLAVVAAGSVAAVQAVVWHGSVTVLANWTGDEQQKFEKITAGFEHDNHIRVVYQGSSAESQVLSADVESGTPPDVAVLPGPGELAGYAAEGLLTPLDDVVDKAGFAPTWVPRVSGPGGEGDHHYWVPVKTDLKSLVWHPATLDSTALATAARTHESWCLGMASDATSGWPGSDWIEDILLQQSGQATYAKWANGKLSWRDDAVERAWTTWADMVHSGDADRTKAALTTAYGVAANGALADPPTCELEHQAGFARSSKAWNGPQAAFTHSAAVIPHADPTGPARWEVSGDLAAVFHDSPQARKLIAYLASDKAQSAWSGTKYGFSVRSDVLSEQRGTKTTVGRIAEALSDPKAVHCYDASDAMPPAVRDAFAQAALRYLADPTPATLTVQLNLLDQVVEHAGSTPQINVCSPQGG